MYSPYLCRNLRRLPYGVYNSGHSTCLEDGNTLKIMKHEGNIKSGSSVSYILCNWNLLISVKTDSGLGTCKFLPNSAKTNYFLIISNRKKWTVMLYGITI